MRYKISAVSYLNTMPFIYSINNSSLRNSIRMKLDYPSMCADKLLSDNVDIALAPVVVLNSSSKFRVISDYCIGSDGKVQTVCLYSNVPLKDIKKIYLDSQSRTSVELLKVLCKEYWRISPAFISSNIATRELLESN